MVRFGHGVWAERRIQLPSPGVESVVREAIGEALNFVRLVILFQVRMAARLNRSGQACAQASADVSLL